MKQKVQRPVLRYHGGKFLLAKWITSYFPKHRVYVECFGGGGSVLMQKQRSYAEVYNDKWDTVVNVFEVLRDAVSATELERRLRLTPYARTEFNKCGELAIAETKDPIEKARLTIFRSFAGFGSASTNAKHSTGFRANSNRSGTTPAQDWLNYPNHIKSFIERLMGVVIENKDYREVIRQHDGGETLFYLDPPYVHNTRNMQRGNAAYAYEMTDDDHREMANVINEVKGMAIISGYESELYNNLFSDWVMVKRKAFADGAVERVECLWINNRASNALNTKLF
jgi:DNA adenine methylase